MEKEIHILLIEDDPDDIVFLEGILSQVNETGARFRFHYAYRLDQGIERLTSGDIDVILLDLSLPDSRGMDTLMALESCAKSIPTLVLTKLDDNRQALEAVRKGAQDYLVKGHLNRDSFMRAVRHAVERSKITKELYRLAEELGESNERLEKLVMLDPLTEILNRRGIEDALSREIQRTRRGDSSLLALIMDIDNFKAVNDSLGHAVGDVVLKEISQRLKSAVRQMDYVARIGGDEFLILMPQTRTAEGVRVAEKIRRGIAGFPVSRSLGESFRMTASLGLVAVNPDILSIDDLLKKTHPVLSKSKNRGKNRVSYDSRGDNVRSLTEILTALREGKNYRALKQPIVRLSDNARVGYEFLSRFSIQDLEMPEDFFHICLENNILTLADHQCLKNSIHASLVLASQTRKHFNIFPSTLVDTPIQSLLQTFNSITFPSTCCIELSEQHIVGDPSYLIHSLRILRERGFLVAIDDVGFGQSSLESLIVLEPDIVKVDKRWINGIARDEWRLRLLKRVLKITNALDSDMVAEGIETTEDRDILNELGVKYGQGFFLGIPA